MRMRPIAWSWLAAQAMILAACSDPHSSAAPGANTEAAFGSTSGATSGAEDAPELAAVEPIAQLVREGWPEMPDFSYAGYRFGLQEPPLDAPGRVFNVTDYGAAPDDGLDDTRAVLSALDAASKIEGPVIVQFPAGRIEISDIIPIERSQIVLRGAGAGEGGTQVHFPRPLRMVESGTRFDEIREYLVKYKKRQREPARNIDMLFSEYSWTGGFIWIQKPGTRAAAYLPELDAAPAVLAQIKAGRRGDRVVEIADTSQLAVGDAVQVQWFNRAGPDGPLIQSIYGDTELEIGSHHWTYDKRPLVRQTTRIASIDGVRVSLGDPLMHEVSDALPAHIAQWDHVSEVGIEDIHFTFPVSPYFGHHLESGYNAIYMTSVIDGWVRDVAFSNADSGLLSYNSANLTISNVHSKGARPAHYAVHLGNVHNALVRDITISNPVIHSLTFNTQATRSVYQRATVEAAAVLDQHAGSNHQNLFDSVTLHVAAERDDEGPFYDVWNGSGAPYWQPGHGRFNTTWNLKVIVESGAGRGETVRLQGLAEGPDARVIGVTGNRPFAVDYRPQPHISHVNAPPPHASLYDWQRAQRLEEAAETRPDTGSN